MKDFIEEYWEKDALPALIEFGKIPNVSPSYAATWSEDGHMDRAAEFLKSWAESRDIPGMTVELLREDTRTPLLFIEVPGNRDETVLIYGHLDKQPPMLPWREGLDPWSPVREGDLLYGRGLADDGYSMFAALGAIEAVLDAGGVLPRICIMIEASEESGSTDLEHYVAMLKEKIGNPSIIITLDSEDRDGDRLWLTQSLRGAVNGYLTVETYPKPMHSGLYSGVIPSANRILRLLLARIENPETGHVLNEVINPPLSDRFKEYAETVARDIPDFLDSYELPAGLSAVADSLPELVANNLVRPALEVTGVTGYPEAEKSGNVSVGKVTVRVSMRIGAGVDPETVATEMKQVFETDTPYGAKVTYTVDDRAWGWMANPLSPKLKERLWSVTKELFGTEPGFLGIGGTIPFANIMTRVFPEAEHILTGLLSHSSNAHGANENMSITKVKKLTTVIAHVLKQ